MLNAPLFRLTAKGDIRFTFILVGSGGLVGMFCTIKDKEFSGVGLGRDEVGILRHITRSVDFSFVSDRLDDFDSRFGCGVRSNLYHGTA